MVLRNETKLVAGWLNTSMSEDVQMGSVIARSAYSIQGGSLIPTSDISWPVQGAGGPSDFGDINPIVSKWTEYPKKVACKGDILITVKGSGVGKVNIMNEGELAISRQLMAIRTKDIHPTLIYHFLRSQNTYFQSLANGAAIPGISRDDVLGLKILIPAPEKQIYFVTKIEKIEERLHFLKANYHQQTTALKELKQSILQKAFSGGLTAGFIDTKNPEYAANVIAVAFDKHEQKQKQKTFKHVKTQKILHLTESVAGIDLGRNPIKDAAGPNDFAHMKKATRWAEKNSCFKFVKRGKGYDFVKLEKFNEFLSQSYSVLKSEADSLYRVIDLFIPMNKEQSEVLATVHAAWNNLLLDGKNPSDDEIVFEARENWHPDKLKIDRHKFFDAIAFIRNQKIIPQGEGKRVESLDGQETLI